MGWVGAGRVEWALSLQHGSAAISYLPTCPATPAGAQSCPSNTVHCAARACRATDPTFLSPYVRISYSHASEDQIREGMRRLGQVLRERAAAAGAAGNGSGACGASAADGSVAVAVAAATRAVLGAANIASSS